MARHVTGPIVRYNDIFFDWLRPQMLMVDDYAYASLEFRGDLDLVLPEGSQWGYLGKKYILSLQCFCYFFSNMKCFYVLNPMTNQFFF
jgi:hypothetical protein